MTDNNKNYTPGRWVLHCGSIWPAHKVVDGCAQGGDQVIPIAAPCHSGVTPKPGDLALVTMVPEMAEALVAAAKKLDFALMATDSHKVDRIMDGLHPIMSVAHAVEQILNGKDLPAQAEAVSPAEDISDSEMLDWLAQQCFYPDDLPETGVMIAVSEEYAPHGSITLNEAQNATTLREVIKAAMTGKPLKR